MILELRTGVTNQRLRSLLQRAGSPTSGNKDRLTYEVAVLFIRTRGAQPPIFETRDRSLISHCLGCVRSWREETREAVQRCPEMASALDAHFKSHDFNSHCEASWKFVTAKFRGPR
jgi:hypothetical protein